jgi:hypothetical protein
MGTCSLALMVMVLGIVATPAIAFAQEHALAYAFAGPTFVSGPADRPLALSIGGGGELMVGRPGTAVGVEIGSLWFPAIATAGWRRPSISDRLVSINASHYFYRPDRRVGWEPFVTGGLSIVGASEGVPALNVGGGVHRWFAPHVGVRLDVREHVSPGLISLLGLRVGVVFR